MSDSIRSNSDEPPFWGYPAPADARPHARWSRPAKVAAYLVLLMLAVISIWFINRRVDQLANLPSSSPVRSDESAAPPPEPAALPPR